MTDLLGLLVPWLLKGAIDALPKAASAALLLKYSGLIVLVVLLQSVTRYFWRRDLYGVSRKIEYELRDDYFAHLQTLSQGYYSRTKTGDLMSRATNDLGAVREFLGLGFLGIMDAIITITASIALMVVIDPGLTLLALAPLPIASFAVVKLGRIIGRRFEKVQRQLSTLSAAVQEGLSGIRVIQAYVQEGAELGRFKTLSKAYMDDNMSLVRIRGFLWPLLIFLIGSAAAIVLWSGGRRVLEGSMTLGSFVAFNGYLAQLTWPTIALGYVINLFERGSASMRRIDEVLSTRPEIFDSPIATGPAQISGDIEFKNLSFSYDGASRPVLKNIDLKIKKGSFVVITGPTGSGKTTLVSLLSRIYSSPPGTIFIDGVEVEKISLLALRKNIGLVAQDRFLFSDTFRENIGFGLELPDMGRIVDASAAAHMKETIEEFPLKYETVLGERGVSLSGGQKQRTAIARGIAVDAPIIVLDDPFSNVDSQAEEKILMALRERLKGKTCIIISHRLSAFKEADEIIVLSEGRIVERGTHNELMARGGLYANLYRKQLLQKELDEAPSDGNGPNG